MAQGGHRRTGIVGPAQPGHVLCHSVHDCFGLQGRSYPEGHAGQKVETL
jgi:hypothetical protein